MDLKKDIEASSLHPVYLINTNCSVVAFLSSPYFYADNRSNEYEYAKGVACKNRLTGHTLLFLCDLTYSQQLTPGKKL